ncbi:2-acyl-glycerophospho-ethanolamine acyltransferase [Cytobacillus horneckiae]|uniref:2-acyl-glycerophospho-ethanolamine acyltransferase n=1 Tax=Cytobacillus horneckiae TaxID=549687 RepID=UPI003D1D2DF3
MRKDLKIFTTISFYTALSTVFILFFVIIFSVTSAGDRVVYLFDRMAAFAFLATIFGLPLSVVSLFSKEKLSKRIFCFVGNLSPISITMYALTLEFIDEFLRTAP